MINVTLIDRVRNSLETISQQKALNGHIVRLYRWMISNKEGYDDVDIQIAP